MANTKEWFEIQENEQEREASPGTVDPYLRLGARLLLDALSYASKGDEDDIAWLSDHGYLFCAALGLDLERLDELIESFMQLTPVIHSDDQRMRLSTAPMTKALIAKGEKAHANPS